MRNPLNMTRISAVILFLLVAIPFVGLITRFSANAAGEDIDFTIDSGFMRITSPGIQTITGTVYLPEQISYMDVYDVNADAFLYDCDFTDLPVDGSYDFSCDTSNITTEGTYEFDIYATDETNAVLRTFTIEYGSDLYSMWTFDRKDNWEDDVVNGHDMTIGGNAQQSTTPGPTGVGKHLNTTNGGYLNYDDSAGNYDFSGPNAHFKVEAMIDSSSYILGDRRIVGKYNEANNENTWLLGTYHDGGVYCAVWIDGNQEAQTSGETHLVSGSWNKIGCEWEASTRTLTSYLNDVETGSRVIGGTGYIEASTNYLTINGRPDGNDGANARYDSVKIYDYNQTPSYSYSNEIVFDDTNQYARVTESGTYTITGDVYLDEQISVMDLYYEPTDTYVNCTFDDIPVDGEYAFSCDTIDMQTPGIYQFEIYASDETNEDTKQFTVEYGQTLTGLWTFDKTENFEDEVINSYETTIGNSASQTSTTSNSQGYALDTTSSGYVNYLDSDQHYDFDGSDAHFKVEADIFSSDFATGDKRVVGKYNEADNENTWLLGTYHDGGIYCAVWIDGNQESLSSGGTYLANNTWNKIGCEWNASTRTLTSYINGVETDSRAVGGTAYIEASTNYLTINGRPSGNDGFNGLVDNVAIYDLTLEPVETGDGNPPIIVLDAVDNSDWLIDTTPTFTGTITDEDGVGSAEYLITNRYYLSPPLDLDVHFVWTPFNPDDGTWDETEETFSVTVDELSGDDDYYFYVRATDSFGEKSLYNNDGWIISYGSDTNYLMAFRKVSLEIEDTSNPIISLNNLSQNPTTNSNPVLKGSVNDYDGDTTSPITSIEYRLNSGIWNDATVISSSNSDRTKDFLVQLTNLTPGDYTVEVRATDASGNTNADYCGTYIPWCISGGRSEEECTMLCADEQLFDIQSVEFTVEAVADITPEVESESLSLSANAPIGISDTTSIIGGDRARLPIDYSYNFTQEFYSNEDDFGYLYGDKIMGVANATDGNLWLWFNNNTFGYYNISTDTLTRYPTDATTDAGITQLVEFNRNDSRYLAITEFASRPLIIYSLGTTPEDTTDDSHYTYETLLGGDSGISDIHFDTRGTTLAFYGIIRDTGTQTGEVVWVDTKDTLTNPADDSYTIISQGDGLDDNYVSLYFDNDRDWIIAGSYNTNVLTFINDNDTPENKGDDTVAKTTNNFDAASTFDIIKDSNGYYWIAGNSGVSAINVTSIATLNSSTTYTNYFSSSDNKLSGERPYKLKWVDNTDKGTEEILISTREGSIFAYDYNKTYGDLTDDTYEKFTFPDELYGSFISYEMTFAPDGNTAWMMMPASGLYSLDITREFVSSSELIIYPRIDSQARFVDQFKVTGLQGSNLSGVSMYISNDGGDNWEEIEIDELVRFSSSDSDVQLKLVLNRVDGDTPEVLGVSMSYAVYKDDPINDSGLEIDYPSRIGIGDSFPTEITLKDELDLIPNWNGDVEVNAYDSDTNTIANNCFNYESQTVAMVAGEATVQTEPLCEGEFYFMGTTEDGRSAQGEDIDILGTYIPDPELCGNGVLDEGEQCDYTMEEKYMCEDGENEKVCTTQCLLDDSNCTEQEEDDDDNIIIPVIDDIKEIIEDGEIGDISSSISMAQVANWAVKLISLTLLTLSLPLLPYYIVKMLTGIMYAIGSRKRDKEYGYVYDSYSKEPVSQAIVRIYNKEKLAHTDVTGTYGEFGGELEEGMYTIVVEKPQYSFPSRLISGSSDGNISNVYTGKLEVRNDGEIQVAVPIDRSEMNILEIFKTLIINRTSVLWQIIKVVLFIALLSYSLYAYQISPTVINLVVLIEYALVLGILTISTLSRDIRYGVVRDIYGNILENKKIGVYEREFNKLVTERITDENGKYRFLLKPGEYELRSLDTNYQLDTEKVMTLEDEPSIINEDLTLKSK